MIKALFKTTIIANTILFLLKDADRKGLIKDLVQKIDEVSDKELGESSEKVQLEVVKKVLIPLMKELMADSDKKTKLEYLGLIATEFGELDRKLREIG